MKKIISKLLITIIFLIFPFVALGTDGYYYYYYYSGGKKVFLKRNLDKVCVLTPKTNTNLTEHSLIGTYDFFDYNIVENNVLLSRSLDYDESLTLPCFISNSGKEIIMTEKLNIKLKSLTDTCILEETANQYDLTIIDQDEFMPLWYVASINPSYDNTTIEIANSIYQTGKFAETYPIFKEEMFCGVSWDRNVNEQWSLYNTINDTIDMNMSSAWNIATGKNITVAVVDTGVDLNHIDLEGNIYRFSCDATNAIEGIYSNSIIRGNHGTSVAGIIAAKKDNGTHIAGIAPEAKIMSISSIAEVNSLTYGINWAWKNGADVINCSWGQSTEDIKYKEAIDSALYRGRLGKGCVVVFSSGNYNGEISYPARSNSDILVVGAINHNGNRWIDSNYSGSCFGSKLDVVAPASNLISLIPENSIDSFSKTSCAAPHVAGLVALILERNPELTRRQICNIIEQCTTKVGNKIYQNTILRPNGTWNEEYGYGLIDAYKALLATPRKQEDY